jgi:hypothetical protein
MFTSRDRLLLVLAVAGIALLTPVAFVVTAGRATDPGQSAPPTSAASFAESTPGATAPAVPPVEVLASATTTTEAGTHSDDRLVVKAADKTAVEALARRFVEVWLLPQAERAAQVGAVTSDDFAPQVAEIPDDALPKTSLADLVDTQTDGRQAYVTARLADGSTVVAYVVLTADGWRVAGLDEA